MFKSIFTLGRRTHHRFFTLISMPCESDSGKVAFVCGKKTGSAVTRNRVKRRLKAIYYDHECPRQGKNHVVFIGKQACLDSSYDFVKKNAYDLLSKVNACYE